MKKHTRQNASTVAAFIVILVIAAVGMPVPGLPGAAFAETTGAPVEARLSQNDKTQIGRMEQYLNSIKTMQTRFLQVASTGNFAEGTIYMSRPGKMRIEYDKPLPILIVANGTFLIYIDKKMEQTTYIPLGMTPAAILLAKKVSLLGGDLIITALEKGPATFEITLVKRDDPLAGSLSLMFSDRPFALRKWTIIDAQGVMTTVSLNKSRFGLPLNADLFEFHPPQSWDHKIDR